MSYRVVEIFDSIQSEGTHAGRAAVFIRLFGCNLQCDFGNGHACDEPLHTQKSAIEKMSIETIVNRARSSPKLVIITGGEPSLVDLNSLIEALQEAGKFVAVETNGTNWSNIKTADWITYSPKFEWDKDAPSMHAGFHELKLLAGPLSIPDESKWATVKNKYLQPIALGEELSMTNMRWCHNYVINNPQWKLSLQYHKFLGAE